MAELEDLTFDVGATADELARRIRAHQDSVGQRIAVPDTRPLFAQAPDGAIVDRAGNVLRPAPGGGHA